MPQSSCSEEINSELLRCTSGSVSWKQACRRFLHKAAPTQGILRLFAIVDSASSGHDEALGERQSTWGTRCRFAGVGRLLARGQRAGMSGHRVNSGNAGGFAVHEQSVYGQRNIFAGIAAGGALSSMFWNPATMTQFPGKGIEVGASALFPLPQHSHRGYARRTSI